MAVGGVLRGFGGAKLLSLRVSLLTPFLGLGERTREAGEEGGTIGGFRGQENMAWCLEPVRTQKSAS